MSTPADYIAGLIPPEPEPEAAGLPPDVAGPGSAGYNLYKFGQREGLDIDILTAQRLVDLYGVTDLPNLSISSPEFTASGEFDYDLWLRKRVSSLPLGFIYDSGLSDYLVFSLIPDETLAELGRGLETAYPWLKANEGDERLLAAAGAAVLGDPEQRDFALELLRQIKDTDFGNVRFDEQKITLDINPESEPERAAIAKNILQRWAPGVKVQFNTPGIGDDFVRALDTGFEALTDAANVIASPVSVASYYITKATIGDDSEAYLSPLDTLKLAAGKGIGGALQEGVGLDPGEEGGLLRSFVSEFAAPVADFAAQWYLDPLMLVSKIGAGARAAGKIPSRMIEEGSDAWRALDKSNLAKSGVSKLVPTDQIGPTGKRMYQYVPKIDHSRITQKAFDFFSKTPDQWLVSKDGRRMGDQFWDYLSKSPADAAERMVVDGVFDTNLASYFSKAGSRKELDIMLGSALRGGIGATPADDIARLSQLAEDAGRVPAGARDFAALADEAGVVAPAKVGPGRVSQEAAGIISRDPVANADRILEAHEILARNRLRSLGNPVLTEFPDAKVLKDLIGTPENWLENMALRASKLKRGVRDSKPGRAMMEEFKDVRVLDPFGTAETRAGRAFSEGARNQGIKTTLKYANKIGIPKETQRELAKQWIRMKSSQDFHEFMEAWGEAIRFKSNLPAPFAQELSQIVRNDLTRAWSHLDEVNPRGGPGHTPILGRTTKDGTIADLPSWSAQANSGFRMPHWDTVIDATSTFRKMANRLKIYDVRTLTPKGKAAAIAAGDIKQAAPALNGAIWFLNWSTELLRESILIPRSWALEIRQRAFGDRGPLLGALPLRQIGEQHIRASLNGYGSALTLNREARRTAKRARQGEGVFDVDFDPTDVGSLEHQLLDVEPVSGTTLHELPNLDAATEGSKGAYHSLNMDFLGGLHNSPEVRRVATDGVEGAKKWLRETDEGRYIDRDMKRIYDQNDPERLFPGEGLDPQTAWLRGIEKQIDAVAGNNPAIRHAIATGDLRAGFDELTEATAKDIRKKFGKPPEQVADDYAKAVADQTTAQTALEAASLAGNTDEVRALTKALKDLKRQINDYTAAGVSDAAVSIGRLGDPKTARRVDDHLRQLYESKAWVPQITRFPGKIRPDYKHVAEWRERLRQHVYGDLLGAADLKYSRIPLAREIYARQLSDLVAAGVPLKRAKAEAKVIASKRTADLLYDLAAKTSFQRQTKWLFPFGAAHQELMTTWLKRIPARHALPGLDKIPVLGTASGAFYLAERADKVLDLFTDLGYAQWEEGRLMVRVPVLSELLEALVPGKAELRFNVLGLSFIGSSLLPTPTPLPSAGLKQLMKHSEAIDGLSTILFGPFAGEVTVGSQPLNLAHSLITGGNVPPWEFASAGAQERIYDYAKTDAFRAALLELQHERPKPEDYDDPNEYDKAKAGFIQKVQDRADRRVGIFTWFKLIGSMVSPVSIRTDDPIKLETQKAFDDVQAFAAGSPLAEAAWGSVRSKYGPAAETIYRTPRGIRSQQASVENAPEPEGVEEYFDHLNSGLIDQLNPDEYAEFVVGMLSYADHLDRLDHIRREFGPDVPSLLRNIGPLSAAKAEENGKWQTHLAWTKEDGQFGALFEKKRQNAYRDGKTPPWVQEIETLRDTANRLRALEPNFTIDGRRDPAFKEFQSSVNAQLRALEAIHGENAIYGEPQTQAEKDMAWYWEQVSQYSTVLSELYAQNKPEEAQAYKNRFSISKDGIAYPTPEEVFWSLGAHTPEEEEAAKVGLATKPVEWLTNFEKSKLGPGGAGADALPYERILSYGLLTDDPAFGRMAAFAGSLNSSTRAAGYKPGGGSQIDVANQDAAISEFLQLAETDPEIAKALDLLVDATGMDSERAAIRAVFFDRWF